VTGGSSALTSVHSFPSLVRDVLLLVISSLEVYFRWEEIVKLRVDLSVQRDVKITDGADSNCYNANWQETTRPAAASGPRDVRPSVRCTRCCLSIIDVEQNMETTSAGTSTE